MQSFTFLSFFAASSFATKLLLPLYQYPEGATWDPVYAAIEANPDLIFQIILNADSGPGGPTPDSNFVTGTAKLNSYANVQTLGYVHCLYGEASQDEVNQNVTDWAAWSSSSSSSSGANTTVGGIFFDETPNTEGGTTDVSFMQSVVTAASTAFAAASSSSFTSMLNPGSSVEHAEFWALADYIVVYESDASDYTAAVLTTNIPAGKAAQSSILIYDFASTGTEALAAQWLAEMTAAGVGSAHILAYDYIQATTAETPASIASVAIALAVVPAAAADDGTGASEADAAGAGTTASVALPETETPPTATTLVTAVTPVVTSVAPSETTVDAEPAPAPAVASESSAAVGTASDAQPTQTASGNHRHGHHYWRGKHSGKHSHDI